MKTTKMVVYRKGLTALRLMENGAIFAYKMLENVLAEIKANGWSLEEFWQYAGKH